ncbi:MAG: Mor transcription activator family protein [Pseudohongiella sp.]|nr:Mor transcription activator family protein [Pseudohongiella sp.]
MNSTPTRVETRRNDLLQDVAEVTGEKLIKVLGLPEERAAEVGNAIADFLAEHWRGQNIYFPGAWRFKCMDRDWEIHRRMERGNAPDLAAEFGISFVRVYQIFKRCQQQLKLERAQKNLNDKGKK